MPLITTVKVSHISNLSDARYCSGMGVDLLGFRVIPGTKYYMPQPVFQDIRGWLAGPRIVAELYGLTSEEQIQEAVQQYAPDYFELSAVEFNRYAHALTLPCIVYSPDPSALAALEGKKNVSYGLVDEPTNCSDITSVAFPVLVKVSSIDQMHDKLSQPCFKGVVLQGPEEQRPGVTNYEQLGTLLEALDN